MENKLEQLTRKLYDEGLSKGRNDAETLVAEAEAKAKKIVADANAQAEKIIAAAKQNAEELNKNTKTEISLASKQVIGTLKEHIASMIVAKSAGKAVAEANMDPAFVKEVLLSVAKNWNGASTGAISLEAFLPAAKKAELDKAFGKSAKEILDAGVEVTYSDGVKTGFKIGPKGGGYHISFTDADFDALLGEYLRPKVSQILYSE